MPCKDVTSRIVVWLDQDESLINFDFTKLSCAKVIGGGTPFMDRCVGHHLDDILSIDFKDALTELGGEDEEENFFMYLEWDALRAALFSYSGKEIDSEEKDRYQVASILHTDEGTKISMVIKALSAMPKVLACCHHPG